MVTLHDNKSYHKGVASVSVYTCISRVSHPNLSGLQEEKVSHPARESNDALAVLVADQFNWNEGRPWGHRRQGTQKEEQSFVSMAAPLRDILSKNSLTWSTSLADQSSLADQIRFPELQRSRVQIRVPWSIFQCQNCKTTRVTKQCFYMMGRKANPPPKKAPKTIDLLMYVIPYKWYSDVPSE